MKKWKLRFITERYSSVVSVMVRSTTINNMNEVKIMEIKRYIYLAITIIMIRSILGIVKIFDMNIEGLIGSVLTGMILLFLLETMDYYIKRYRVKYQ